MRMEGKPRIVLHSIRILEEGENARKLYTFGYDNCRASFWVSTSSARNQEHTCVDVFEHAVTLVIYEWNELKSGLGWRVRPDVNN